MPKCPICETEGAYIGILEIECRNSLCKFYSEKQYYYHLNSLKYSEGPVMEHGSPDLYEGLNFSTNPINPPDVGMFP